MPGGRERIVRAASWAFAVLMFLGGAAALGAMAFLIAAFGSGGFVKNLVNDLFNDWLLALVVLCGAGAMALAPFIWRQRAWAMLTALALAVAFRFMFGNETLLLNVLLTGVAVFFAVCTGLRLWLGQPAR